MSNAPRIHAVQPVLMARDVAVSLRFFEQLGFAPCFQDTEQEPRYAGVRRDGIELHLQWGDAGQWVEGKDRPVYRFLVGDVDALHREFAASGVSAAASEGSPWAQPSETPWGTREFHLRDPGGNGLQFYQPL